jgi:hypothetical protein
MDTSRRLCRAIAEVFYEKPFMTPSGHPSAIHLRTSFCSGLRGDGSVMVCRRSRAIRAQIDWLQRRCLNRWAMSSRSRQDSRVVLRHPIQTHTRRRAGALEQRDICSEVHPASIRHELDDSRPARHREVEVLASRILGAIWARSGRDWARNPRSSGTPLVSHGQS